MHIAPRLLAALALLVLPAAAEAGAIVVNHDTATLNTSSPGVARFAQNLVRFLDSNPAAGGSVLVFNRTESLGNPGNLADTFFVQAVSAIGYQVTVADQAAPFSLATLAAHDIVLLAGRVRNPLGQDVKDDAVLDAYVAQGGGVYIAAGVGFAGEAAYWNSFLDDYGLAFRPELNNRVGPVAPGFGPLFDGVGPLNAGNGNDIVLTGGNPHAAIVQFVPGSTTLGLTASFVAPAAATVAEPGTFTLLLGALGLLGLACRRRPPPKVRRHRITPGGPTPGCAAT